MAGEQSLTIFLIGDQMGFWVQLRERGMGLLGYAWDDDIDDISTVAMSLSSFTHPPGNLFFFFLFFFYLVKISVNSIRLIIIIILKMNVKYLKQKIIT